MFCKESVLKSFAQACNFIQKKVLTQVFSCKFCEIFKKTYFYKTPPVTASEHGITKIEIAFQGSEFCRCAVMEIHWKHIPRSVIKRPTDSTTSTTSGQTSTTSGQTSTTSR